MRLTNYLLLTVLVIVIAILVLPEIGKSIQNSANGTAEKIRSTR